MAAAKKPQSDTMLYTLITFVAFFVVATTIAVIYYVKFEKQSQIAEASQNKLRKLVTASQQQKGLGKIVGTIPRGNSALGTLVDYLDEMVSLATGEVPEPTSAEVKVDKAKRQAKAAVQLTQKHIDIDDPNTTGLIQIIEKLKAKLDNVTAAELALKKQLEDLQKRFDDVMAATSEKEQVLLAEKEKLQQQVNEIEQDYKALENLLRKSTDEQVQILSAQLNKEKANREELNRNLLKTQAELKIAQGRLKRFQDLLSPPDNEVIAYKGDGKIILIDDRTKTVIVHLNIGSDDRVYPGLTFSVYDRNMPIPRDGRGKAEIEVFNVGKNISQARVTRSEVKRPIVPDDIVANLVWDSDRTNVFAVEGEFDLDGDGAIDDDAVDEIRTLIEKWGGRVTDTISINTDFLVLGTAPKIRPKPSFEEMELDPMAMEKHEASLRKRAHYEEVQSQTQVLSIPIFNIERFLYFIGYKSQSDRPGAF